MNFQRVRDPLHNLIQFDQNSSFENEMWRIVQTRPFQRLRRIKQLGFTEFVFPGATHSRFAHSIGVFHTARMLDKIVKEKAENPHDTKAQVALAAALVHDLGHGPFSHAFEDVGKRLNLKLADHEHVSGMLIRDSEVSEILNERSSGFANDVANIIDSKGPKTIYSAMVSSQFDADRLDYMRRDRLMTGTQHAAIDFEWLLANLEVGKVSYGVDGTQVGQIETFILGPKAIYNAEAYVLGLFQLYPTVYFHKTTRGIEKLFSEVLVRIFKYALNGDHQLLNLANNHPLIRFAKEPADIERVLELDDSVVWGALSLLASSSDCVVAEYSKRIRDRKLLKCVDLRAEVSKRKPKVELEELDLICDSIKGTLREKSEHKENEVPLILFDEGKRSPYRTVDESESPIGRINIRTADRLCDLKDISEVVKAVRTFKFDRVYFDRDLVSTQNLINDVIGEETKV